jgi:hypothetical protein
MIAAYLVDSRLPPIACGSPHNLDTVIRVAAPPETAAVAGVPGTAVPSSGGNPDRPEDHAYPEPGTSPGLGGRGFHVPAQRQNRRCDMTGGWPAETARSSRPRACLLRALYRAPLPGRAARRRKNPRRPSPPNTLRPQSEGHRPGSVGRAPWSRGADDLRTC